MRLRLLLDRYPELSSPLVIVFRGKDSHSPRILLASVSSYEIVRRRYVENISWRTYLRYQNTRLIHIKKTWTRAELKIRSKAMLQPPAYFTFSGTENSILSANVYVSNSMYQTLDVYKALLFHHIIRPSKSARGGKTPASIEEHTWMVYELLVELSGEFMLF